MCADHHLNSHCIHSMKCKGQNTNRMFMTYTSVMTFICKGENTLAAKPLKTYLT